MARGCSESDSEEERHDRFRSERNNISTNSSKSLFSTGLDQINKSRSPLRRLNSPSRRDRRSPTKRSRSRSNRRSKERRKSKDRRDSKEKTKKEDKNSSSSRSSSRSKETSRRSDGKESRSETGRRSHSKSKRRSRSEEKKRRRENKRYLESGETNDTFLLRFERRRPSVENEVVENTVTYRDSSPEINERVSMINSNKYESSRSHKKEKKRKRSHGETEEGELISEEENNCFGPALPPRLDDDQEEEEEDIKDSSAVAEGPALPPGFSQRERDAVFGPQLPDRHCKKSNSQENTEKCTNLGSNTKNNTDDESRNEKRLIGPMLPPTKDRVSTQADDKEVAQYGPALPPQSSSSPSSSSSMDVDEEDLTALIGPLPKGMELDDNVQRILEERAHYLRKQLENKDSGEFGGETGGRESWMLELPEGKTSAQLGLGPRKFKIREGPDMSDRSSWTDIPGSKKNKKENSDKVNDESRRLEITARNEEMENLCKKTSKNETSLLELHQKELKKKRKKEHELTGGKVERRPFSREIDLQTNRFDDAQRKSVINKAQLLNSRFASGESKYL